MIAFDASSHNESGGASSITVSHICTGSNLFLYVVVFGNGTSCTGVTYNGVALTKVNETGTNFYSHWYLVGPASGTHNIVASFGSAGNYNLSATSYTGVSQTGQPDASVNMAEHTSSTSETLNLTTVADNCWVLMAWCAANGGTLTAGGGTTLRIGHNGQSAVLDSNSAKTPAGAVTLSCSTTAAASVTAGGGISISPAVAAGVTTAGWRSLIGVGN